MTISSEIVKRELLFGSSDIGLLKEGESLHESFAPSFRTVELTPCSLGNINETWKIDEACTDILHFFLC